MSDENADLIEALGGGHVGRDRLARLQQTSSGQTFAEKCMDCKRWFVLEEFQRAVAGTPEVLLGPRDLCRCRACLWPGGPNAWPSTGNFIRSK